MIAGQPDPNPHIFGIIVVAILGTIAASITPRPKVVEAQIQISPKKELRRQMQDLIPVIRADEELYVVNYDGSACVKQSDLPTQSSSQSMKLYITDSVMLRPSNTVELRRFVICGDSNVVTRHARGEINCKAPGLALHKQEAWDRLRDWPDHALLHVKRDWNDGLANADQQRRCGVEIESVEVKQDLITVT
ncbi:LOW QUALITY PROTEIN: reverse transcriptase [Phytophthora palmivora]|uniref:Reverse transcriptase n=1 Tax=Phytophthora palmivora TaxID=4796 RepID=A0A2P4X2X3_9STRA|nr:LOW QUALITY PROTEIN: reverse transcriptase [Phytophthora palmivora]